MERTYELRDGGGEVSKVTLQGAQGGATPNLYIMKTERTDLRRRMQKKDAKGGPRGTTQAGKETTNAVEEKSEPAKGTFV